ncbi:hypothetical protein LAZ67_8000241 [Cordylochernes scorpioides]|uniref:Uncharacterized protein n=1 Tax=Cordylochernes scorpioides TaxID=51811 RepID=A0ABY6KP74_9ARAC|nr:hypothetical protein LAZ67_8000241 [Cordylochernes scorpioides]
MVPSSIEAQFLINNIKSENTRFNYLIAQLDPKYVENLWDIITSKEINKYSEAKERLLRIFKDGESKRIRKLLSGIELGDLKPSQLLQKLRLATEDIQVCYTRTTKYAIPGHPSMLYQDYQVCYTRTSKYAIPGLPSMLYQDYQVCYTRSTKYAIPGVPCMLYQEYQICYTRRTKNVPQRESKSLSFCHIIIRGKYEEQEADMLGMALAHKAGFDLNGVIPIFENPSPKSFYLKTLFDTHPTDEERRKFLEDFIKAHSNS